MVALEDLLEARFGEVDPVGTAKHEIYRLYQANKDLELFLNTFFVLAKKAKLDDNQTLDLLYEKLSDKFKSVFVTKKRQTNLRDLIRKLRSMDASMKVINQQKQPSNLAINTVKPASTSKLAYQQASQSTPITTSLASTPFTATGSHPGPMDLSSAGKQRSLMTEEKERQNKLGLCRYCGQPGHIAHNHSDSATLLAKRQAAGIYEITMAPLATLSPLSENASSPSIVGLGDH